MPKLLKQLSYWLLTVLIIGNLFLLFAVDDTPLLKIHESLNREDIQRAKQILHLSPEERDQIKTISLNQKDINIATSYLLNHFVQNTTLIQIGEHDILAQLAIYVPKTLWGQYLDIYFRLIQTTDGIRIKSFKIGEISIPDTAANYLIPAVIANTPLNKYRQLAQHYIKNAQIHDGILEVSYLGSMVDAAKQMAAQKHKDYPNLHLYQQQINDIVAQHDPAWRLSLIELLQPLFASAYQHSNLDNAITENRAVIIAVASYIYKQELRRFLPIGLVYSKEYPVFAYKRVDIPQHFIASALLACVDSSLLSQKLGEDKELGDAENGSGFSFIDLTSDRAGTRFGQLAIANPHQARDLQQRMANINDYSAILPDVQDLPEKMDEASFKARYNEIGSPAYQSVIEEIDKRINNLPFYQP